MSSALGLNLTPPLTPGKQVIPDIDIQDTSFLHTL